MDVEEKEPGNFQEVFVSSDRPLTSSPSDGTDIRWFFSKSPLKKNYDAAAMPSWVAVAKGEFLRFGVRDSLVLEAAFKEREQEFLRLWWKEYAECSIGPGPPLLAAASSDNSDEAEEPRDWLSPETGADEIVGVPVKGGLYEVDLRTRRSSPVYWGGPDRRVLRGLWFARSGTHWLPLREDVAEQLEVAYRSKVWRHRQYEPSGLYAARVPISGTTDGLHALFTGEDSTWEAWLADDNSWTMFFAGSTPGIALRRGFLEPPDNAPYTKEDRVQQLEEELDDYCTQVPVSHMVFMVHGIGQKMETAHLVSQVTEFRRIFTSLSEKFLTKYQRMRQRCLFIPVQWRRGLKLGGEAAVADITLEGVPNLRTAVSATVHDVLYYMSPAYCQDIIDSVTTQLNFLFRKFKRRNPDFSGKVSVYCHSLGSVLLHDILCHQPVPSARPAAGSVAALEPTDAISPETAEAVVEGTGDHPPEVLPYAAHAAEVAENFEASESSEGRRNSGRKDEGKGEGDGSLEQRDAAGGEGEGAADDETATLEAQIAALQARLAGLKNRYPSAETSSTSSSSAESQPETKWDASHEQTPTKTPPSSPFPERRHVKQNLFGSETGGSTPRGQFGTQAEERPAPLVSPQGSWASSELPLVTTGDVTTGNVREGFPLEQRLETSSSDFSTRSEPGGSNMESGAAGRGSRAIRGVLDWRQAEAPVTEFPSGGMEQFDGMDATSEGQAGMWTPPEEEEQGKPQSTMERLGGTERLMDGNPVTAAGSSSGQAQTQLELGLGLQGSEASVVEGGEEGLQGRSISELWHSLDGGSETQFAEGAGLEEGEPDLKFTSESVREDVGKGEAEEGRTGEPRVASSDESKPVGEVPEAEYQRRGGYQGEGGQVRQGWHIFHSPKTALAGKGRFAAEKDEAEAHSRATTSQEGGIGQPEEDASGPKSRDGTAGASHLADGLKATEVEPVHPERVPAGSAPDREQHFEEETRLTSAASGYDEGGPCEASSTDSDSSRLESLEAVPEGERSGRGAQGEGAGRDSGADQPSVSDQNSERPRRPRRQHAPRIHYAKLEFEVDSFFAVGSPLGLFLALRNIRIGTGDGPEQLEGIQEEMPACKKFLNIFHPYDPVAYRIEPLISREYVKLKPVFAPHHKGGKRPHIELQEWEDRCYQYLHRLARQCRRKLRTAKRRVVNVFSRTRETKQLKDVEDEEEQRRQLQLTEYSRRIMTRLTGSPDGRIDYMLQEATFDYQYIVAFKCHTTYWGDYDSALLIIQHLYQDIPRHPSGGEVESSGSIHGGPSAGSAAHSGASRVGFDLDDDDGVALTFQSGGRAAAALAEAYRISRAADPLNVQRWGLAG